MKKEPPSEGAQGCGQGLRNLRTLKRLWTTRQGQHTVGPMTTACSPSVVARAERQVGRAALVDPNGTYTYDDLLDASARVAAALLAGRADLFAGPRHIDQ